MTQPLIKPGTYKAIILAAIGGFIVSSIWYVLFGGIWMETRGTGAVADERSPIATALVELARNLLLSGVLAYFIVRLQVTTGPQVLQFYRVADSPRLRCDVYVFSYSDN